MDPISLAIGLGVKFLPDLLGHLFGDNAKEVATDVGKVIQDVTGENTMDGAEKALAANPAMLAEVRKQAMEIKDREDQRRHDERMLELDIAASKMAKQFEDTMNARSTFGQNEDVIRLAKGLLLAFTITIVICIIGSFMLLGGLIKINSTDPGLTAAVFGFLGTVFGALASAVMMVVSFFFGSSQTADAHSSAMTQAVAKFGEAVVKK